MCVTTRFSIHSRQTFTSHKGNWAVKNESSWWVMINIGTSMLRSAAISSFKLISTLINEGQASETKFMPLAAIWKLNPCKLFNKNESSLSGALGIIDFTGMFHVSWMTTVLRAIHSSLVSSNLTHLPSFRFYPALANASISDETN